MGWMSRLINRHNGKEKCLVCDAPVGKDAAVVEYKYQDGKGQAFLCEKCEAEFNQSKLDDIDEAL